MADDEKYRVRPGTLAAARRLRSPQTPAEVRLWRRLRAQQLGGLKFRRQHPIGRFVADFCCPAQRLVVEIDGDTHAEQEESDAARTDWLTEQGYRVIRFTNEDVHRRLDAVLAAIYAACGGMTEYTAEPCEGEGARSEESLSHGGRG